MQENEYQKVIAKDFLIYGSLLYAFFQMFTESHHKRDFYEWGLFSIAIVLAFVYHFPVLQNMIKWQKPAPVAPVVDNSARIRAKKPPSLQIPAYEPEPILEQMPQEPVPLLASVVAPRAVTQFVPPLPPFIWTVPKPPSLMQYRADLIEAKGDEVIRALPEAKCQLMLTCMKYPVKVSHGEHFIYYDYDALEAHVKSATNRSNMDPIMNVPLKDCKIEFDAGLQEAIVTTAKKFRSFGEYLRLQRLKGGPSLGFGLT